MVFWYSEVNLYLLQTSHLVSFTHPSFLFLGLIKTIAFGFWWKISLENTKAFLKAGFFFFFF